MKRSMAKFANLSLRRKSLAIFLLLVILPSLFVGFVVLYTYDSILKKQFQDEMEKNLNTIELNVSEKIKAIDDISDYMIYEESFRRFMTMHPTPSNAEQIGKYKTAIEGFFAFQLMSKNYIKSISLQGFNGNDLQMGEPVSGKEQHWIDLAEAKKGGIVWTDSYPITSGWTGPKRVISMVRIINSFDKTSLPVGRVIVRLDESDISKVLTNAVPASQGSIFIVRSDGEVLLHSDKSLIGRPFPDSALAKKISGHVSTVFDWRGNGESYLVFAQHMDSTGWNIVAMVNNRNIVKQTQAVKTTIQILMLVFLLFGVFALIGFELAIIRPILDLKKETFRVIKGDFSAKVTIRSRDEIGTLSRQFNTMVQTVRELIDKKYKLEIRQRDSELKMLQSQMDPHFLYNTLDMIRWTARLEKAFETSSLIETLSRFFRMSLNRKKTHAALEEEIEFVRSYLELQKKRLGGKMEYSLNIEEQALKEAMLLKKTIQPLVENSIKYGLKNRTGIRIEVNGRRDGQDLLVEVKDSGEGFTSRQIHRINEVLERRLEHEDLSGHAICNIHERITILYGSRYGVELPEELNVEGACVRIRVPLLTDMNEDDANTDSKVV